MASTETIKAIDDETKHQEAELQRLREELELAPHPPLFGHPTGRKGLTHWMVFMKPLEKSQ